MKLRSSAAPSFLRLLRFFAAKTGFAVWPGVRAAEKGEMISRKEAQNTQKRKRGIVPGSPFISDGCGRRTQLQRGWPCRVPSFLRILRLFAAKTGPAVPPRCGDGEEKGDLRQKYKDRTMGSNLPRQSAISVLYIVGETPGPLRCIGCLL